MTREYTKDYGKLIGKEVAFFISDGFGRRSGKYGSRRGTVVSVDAGIRKGFRSVRVRMGGHFTSPNGVRCWLDYTYCKVYRKELSMINHYCGVIEGSRVVPLVAWFNNKCIERIGQ